MENFEKLMEYRSKNNEFANSLGIKTVEMRTGYARGEMAVRPEFENSVGSVHGGCYFTLADTIGGAAAASYNRKMTTIDSNFHFLSPRIGIEKLCAEAVEIKHGRTISVYDVAVTDEKGKMLAKGTFSYYNLGTLIIEEQVD